MATTVQPTGDEERTIRRASVTLTPTSRFPVPKSNGYSVYSALLNVLSSVDEKVGESVHDSELGSLHCSGLQGPFGSSDRSHHKTLLPDRTYDLSLGIVHPDDADVFQALLNALVIEAERVELSHGELVVDRFESENTTYSDLVRRAGNYDDPLIEMDFRTATCIEEAGDVTTMVPYRGAVFRSLLGKWNNSCPDGLSMELDRQTVLAQVIEKPDADTYATHSVLVNRETNADGENRNLYRQGFSGQCGYAFKAADESVRNAVTALALFAQYSGVGSDVARGCGSVDVQIK